MKQNNTFIVLRDKKGNYLAGYKNNPHALAYSADWTADIEDALTIPEKYYNDKDSERYLAMAMLFDAELIKVQAEYTLTTLDGEEPDEPVEDDEDELKKHIRELFSILGED